MRSSAKKISKEFAAQNRKQMPAAEVLLWTRFRRLRELGIVIRRQHTLDKYIVDFACIKAKVIVECDGWSHDDQWEEDDARQKWLESEGWLVMRFSNSRVLENPDDVSGTVFDIISERLGPT